MSIPSLPFMAKTKVSWTGEQEGDLGFLENETVKVFHIVDESWWQGSLSRNGTEGIFPRDFVEVISAPSTGLNTPTKPAVGIPTIQTKYGPSPNAKYRTSPDNKNTKSPPKQTHKVYSNPVTPSKADPREREYSAHKASFTPTKNAVNSQVCKYKNSYPSASDLEDFNTSFEHHNRSFERLPAKQKSSQFYSQHVLSSGLTKANTTETSNEKKRLSQTISADNSPVKMRNSLRPSNGHDEFHQTLFQKKQELEKQLHHLMELERSHVKRKQTNLLSDDSYVSEDLTSSKRNHISREDLDHKLEYFHDHDHDHDDYSDSVPPPPPPKHRRVPFDADDFRASGATLDNKIISQVQYPEDLKNSIKSLQSDVLNLSELSATSAGSFSRHKFEREAYGEPMNTEEGDLDISRLSVEDTEELINSVFKSKKPKQNIFKMLQKKKKPDQNLMEQRFLQEPDEWQIVKYDMNRVNTLTSHDKQARTKRVVRSESNFIVKPLESITDVNVSENFGPDDLNQFNINVNTRRVADFSQRYDFDFDFNDLVTDISVKFGASRPDQVRAVLMHLCKFHIIEESGRISQVKPKLSEVMSKGEASIFQLNYLFKKLLQALRIPSEVVFGFWKKPNEFYHSDQFSVNHCWLSVMLETDERRNGCFKLIDLMCFKNGFLSNLEGVNEFYFLASPIDLVSTHIPSVIELQHVCPPIDLNVAFHLPRMYSSFRKHDLELVNFNNSLTRLQDSEFFEADIKIPITVELFTLIKTSRKTSNDYTLCQIYWKGSQRMAKIKAVLPENEEIGVLQIFAGPKGLQTHFDNIHELACVIPLYHEGKGKPTVFVPRYPTIRSQNNDLYIKHPQLSTLIPNNKYSFEVDVHPSMGLNSGSGIMNQDFKLVIESPSGKYTKLVKDEPHKPHGIHQSKILCQEMGLYRGLVIGDTGNSWYVFAQWECAGAKE